MMKHVSLARHVGAKVGMGAGVALAVMSTSANAQSAFAVDSAPVIAIITAVVAFIVAVGTASLAMHFTAKGFKWARRAG